jgi:glutamate-1-semialdehyde 2,1-aminomutase
MSTGRNIDLDTALAEAEQRFTAAHPKSAARHKAAQGVMPGGNTRTVIYYPPFPVTLAKGEGCHVWDLEGRRYADFVGEYTAGLYGHSDPAIVGAIKEALDNGIVLGGPNRYEAELARLLVERFPSLELVRFTNSGTEANLMAIQTARAVTGRSEVMIMSGSYHGGVFVFATPNAPLNVPIPFVAGTYNDIGTTRAAIRAHGQTLAAVIVEPVIGGGGCIPADREFLAMLRDETRAVGAMLIFDEVMTSRLSPTGIQGALGIIPDLTTLGKYLGGGLTFGAFGGSTAVMGRFDPTRADAFPHAGTFNNNVLTMAAGIAGLTKVLTADKLMTLNERGERLRKRMNDAVASRGINMVVTGRGSMIQPHFGTRVVRRPSDVPAQSKIWARLMQLDMLARGYYQTYRGMITLSLPMDDAILDGYARAFEAFLDDHRAMLV